MDLLQRLDMLCGSTTEQNLDLQLTALEETMFFLEKQTLELAAVGFQQALGKN